ISARGFCSTAQLAPYVNFEGQQLQRGGPEIPILRGKKLRGKRCGALARQTIDFDGSACTDIRILVGPRDSERSASFFDAGDGLAEVVVSRKRLADQRLQLFISEYLKPFQIGEGVSLSR